MPIFRYKGDKDDKKRKRRAEHGWDVYNNEAQYRHHKRQMRRAEAGNKLDPNADADAED